jgi:hypothetical protein
VKATRRFEPRLSALIAAREASGERSERGLRELLARMRVTDPQASMRPNERLLVFPRRPAGRSAETRELVMTIIGEESGESYPELVLEIASEDWWPDGWFDYLGPEVAMALNEAWRLPDQLYEAFRELCGRPAFRCARCKRNFVTFSEAESHVRERHPQEEVSPAGREHEPLLWDGMPWLEADTTALRCLVPVLGGLCELPGGGAPLQVRWLE